MSRDMDREIRRSVLKPLVRRRPNIADKKAIIAAFKRIDNIALGADLLRQLQEVLGDYVKDKTLGSLKSPETGRKTVALARALYMSRRFTRQEYVFIAAFSVENVLEGRLSDSDFNDELESINKALERIRKEHGLKPDEYWMAGEGPEEYIQLNKQWEDVHAKLFLKTLKEFGLDDLVELQKTNPDEYDRLRERGRRSFYHKDEIALAIRDIVVRYEEDARKAANAGAYSAAITSIGAALEGLLLLRCFRSKHKAVRIAQKLPRSKRPRFPKDPTTWTFDNLIQVCLEAGWLPTISTSYANFNSAGLANLLRGMRNYVHPGRHAKEKPWSEICERDYRDAHAIYVILLSKVAGIGKKGIKISNQTD